MRNFPAIGFFVISLLLGSHLQAASELSSLSNEARNAISRLCSPVQYREGAAAYRQCVQSEIESAQQGNNSALANLAFDDKYAVQQFCAAAGASHSQCVIDQLASVRNVPAPSMRNVADDEQYAIQQTCFNDQSTKGLLAYRQCVTNELAGLAQLPRIDLAGLPILERNALQLRCSANSKTAAAYRQCLSVEFSSFTDARPEYNRAEANAVEPAATSRTTEALVTKPTQENSLPRPDSEFTLADQPSSSNEPDTRASAGVQTLPTSKALPRNIEPQRASVSETEADVSDTAESDNTTAAKSSQAVATDTGGTIATPDTIELASNTIAGGAASGAADNGSNTNTRIILKPALAEQVQQIGTTRDTGNTEPVPAWAPILDKLNSWQTSTTEKLSSLTLLGKVVAAIAIGIPLLLLLLKRLLGRKREADIPPAWQQQKHAIPGAVPDTLADTEALKARWDDDFLDEDDTIRTTPLELDAVTNPIELEDVDEDTTTTRIVQRPQRQHPPTTSTATQRLSGFGNWLDSLEVDERQQSCTEFLIYWMAYADERFEKGLKQRIFTQRDLNHHDQIKRWVLKQDVFAFADSVFWLKQNTSRLQQEQILDLLMALLITENNITPSQNIILRMLADNFGIGATALQERFRFTFAQELPAFPRPDEQSWWLEQSQQTIARWDARRLAALPQNEQMLSRLGLGTNYAESDVISAFRRAAKRCHPERYSQLGGWEQALAQRQYEKFEQARDWLLGVSA